MRILLTGATGFLGKPVLELLLQNKKVQKIFVISRTQRTHPDPRVEVLKGDLAQPATWRTPSLDVDRIIHLAGLYDFRQTMTHNYRENVLSILGLIDFVRSLPNGAPIYFASTYAVGFGLHSSLTPSTLTETPLEHLPSQKQAYPYTKALAEKALTDSGLRYKIFRLGVLVGDQENGAIEKIDGPYYLYRLAWKLSKLPFARSIPYLPLAMKPDAVLPVVPVDCAAQVIAQALFHDKRNDPSEIYHVCNTQSAPIRDLVLDCFKAFLPQTKISFHDHAALSRLLSVQALLSGVPEHALQFALHPVGLTNEKFIARFGEKAIPAYSTYRKAMLRGFFSYMEGGHEHS